MTRVRAGDMVFRASGEPAVLAKHDEKTGKVTLDRDTQTVREAVRHGFINGLAPDDRVQYNAIMDDTKELKDPRERISMLENRIDKLQEEDLKKNYHLVRYLRAEVAHLTSTYGIRAREFVLDESKLRTA